MSNENRLSGSPNGVISKAEARGYRDLSIEDRELLEREEAEKENKRLREEGLDNFEGVNESEAKKLGLMRVELPDYPEAQRFFNRIIEQNRKDAIDVFAYPFSEISNELYNLWKISCLPLPAPRYLQSLLGGFMRGNIQDPRKEKNNISTPILDGKQIIYIDRLGLAGSKSKLFERISQKEMAVGGSRNIINYSLWENGDEFRRAKNEPHRGVLESLNLDESEFELRPISLFEYWRLINTEIGNELNFNRQKKWTFCNEYWHKMPTVCGYLEETKKEYFDVEYRSETLAHSSHFARLVLARKIKSVS